MINNTAADCSISLT